MKGKSRGRKRKSAEPPSPTPVELSQEVTSTLTQNSSGKFVPKFSKKPKTSKSQPVPSLASHDEQESITLSTSADHIASPSKSHDIPQQLHDSTLQLLDNSPLKSHDIPSQSHDNPSQSHDSQSKSHDVEQVINVSFVLLYYMKCYNYI